MVRTNIRRAEKYRPSGYMNGEVLPEKDENCRWLTAKPSAVTFSSCEKSPVKLLNRPDYHNYTVFLKKSVPSVLIPSVPFPVRRKLTYLYVGIGSKEW